MIFRRLGERGGKSFELSETGQTFFDRLFEKSQELVSRFPLTLEAAAMAYVTGVLEPAVLAERSRNPFENPRATALVARSDVAVGMNTVGMLLDRLSILAMKQWNVTNRSRTTGTVGTSVMPQVTELVEALVQSRPGLSSVYNKLTKHTADVSVKDFSEAYFGLLTTNLLLWEAQEVLYNHDVDLLHCEELRAYIAFFSRGNIARNAYIQASDTLYWRSFSGGPETVDA